MITLERPIMLPMAKAAIEEIKQRGGDCTPEDVLWLQYAAKRCVNPSGEKSLPSLIDCPVFVGGVSLYPLTRGALEWLQNCFGDNWNELDRVAFALSKANKPEELTVLNGLAARIAVVMWRRKLKCSQRALRDAVNFILNSESTEEISIETPLQSKPKSSESNPFHWGDVLCLLCHYYAGTTPKYWLWECSIEFTEIMLNRIQKLVPSMVEKVDQTKFEAFAEFRSIVLHIANRGKQ